MNRKEILEKVLEHELKQKERSGEIKAIGDEDPRFYCSYEDSSGRCCYVGALMTPGELALAKPLRTSVYGLASLLPKFFTRIDANPIERQSRYNWKEDQSDLAWLRRLQRVHDEESSTHESRVQSLQAALAHPTFDVVIKDE